ncbi:MAG: hypothetical protein ABH879_07295 [archaeon]
MNCQNCQKESTWLELIGTEFICHKCISRNPLMGKLLRTHMNSFTHAIKKLKVAGYNDLLKLDQEQLKDVIDLKKVLTT